MFAPGKKTIYNIFHHLDVLRLWRLEYYTISSNEDEVRDSFYSNSSSLTCANYAMTQLSFLFRLQEEDFGRFK